MPKKKSLSEFQLKVLLAASKIPRGRVASYKMVAKMAGCGKASRAVGNSLGVNPFLITIPCHRVVCSDGRLGGYRKGAAIKRKLLLKEGITFDNSGRVPRKFFILRLRSV